MAMMGSQSSRLLSAPIGMTDERTKGSPQVGQQTSHTDLHMSDSFDSNATRELNYGID
jgi:hypothetical protein